MLKRCVTVVLFLVALYAPADAQTAQLPAATPAASATPSTGAPADAGNDPCGGPNRMLATLNRPTVGYSACAVPAGAVVLEEGYQLQTQAGAKPYVLAQYPQGFQRFGVAPGWEADIIGPNFNRLRSGPSVTSGLSDLGAGFKYEFSPKTRFTYAVDGLVTFQSGDRNFTSGATTGTANLDVAYSLSPAVGLGTTLAATNNAALNANGSVGHYGSLNPSFVVTAQLPKATQFYAELVMLTKAGPEVGGRTYFDGGVQQLFGPNFELDVEYGYAFAPLDSRFTYFGIGTGIRLR